MQAVILAAGSGSRIRGHHALPKGFLTLGNEPIIIESINKLKQHGIDDILVVTGYRSDDYESLLKNIPQVSTLKNPHAANRGSLYSLYCAKDWIHEDCLVLESDLLYDARAIEIICKAEQPTVVLVSGTTHSGDEVYVETNANLLINMSKQIETLNKEHILGEFVGINKISLTDYRKLVALLKDNSSLLHTGYYEEDGLVSLARQQPVYCLQVADLLWCEIDNELHFQRAIQLYKALEFRNKAVKRAILLNPGPLSTTQSVKDSLVVTDICHREKEFTDLLRGIRHDLLSVVHAGNDYTSVIFTASGSGAIEACLSSVIPKNSRLAIINNGSYGQRMINIARRYGIDVVDIKSPFDQAIDLKKIEAILQAHPNIHSLGMVHHETSSGILNPLQELGELCQRLGRCFIVDAMSSFAGSEINVYQDHINFLIASSNKCLHGMPGLSFVICDKKQLLQTKNQARSYYFDLYQQYHALEETGQMPFTPAVQVTYSLRQALNEFFIETLAGRIKRYHDNYDAMVLGLRALGFTIVTPECCQSKLLVTVRFPEDGAYDFDALHNYLYARGYTIYPRKLAIDNTFRLACIGHLEKTDIRHFLDELAAYMQTVTQAHEDLV